MSSFVGNALKLAHRARRVSRWGILIVFAVLLFLIFTRPLREGASPSPGGAPAETQAPGSDR